MHQLKFFTALNKLIITTLLLIPSFILAGPLSGNFNLTIAPGTLTECAVTLLWQKQSAQPSGQYQLLFNGKVYGKTTKSNFTAKDLKAGTLYSVQVKGSTGEIIGIIKFKTAIAGKIYNVIDFGAKGDSVTKNTHAIQAAIDACTAGGTVLIPKGTFLSGALFLKSNMTLSIAKGGVLKGSLEVADYLPMIPNRFEGWELKTYASLLNAGNLVRNGSYTVKNLRITGGGTISGGGRKLGDAMVKANGLRSRGRLICLMSCQNVSISDLDIRETPCWNIHYIYSNNITCHDLNIVSRVHNGDGIDPDSSTDSYIFNCTFDTSDDCIAIKSGKNPEGFTIGKPTKNVRITDCDFKAGHGISIGSEMSGGISDIFVQDCNAGKLLHGFQIKGTKERGGYVRNVTVEDCQLLQITIYSEVNYNNDGAAAPTVPVFENFLFRNIDLSKAPHEVPVMNLNGFKEIGHQLKNVTFTNISVPENAKIIIKNASQLKFNNVKSKNGTVPGFDMTDCSDIVR